MLIANPYQKNGVFFVQDYEINCQLGIAGNSLETRPTNSEIKLDHTRKSSSSQNLNLDLRLLGGWKKWSKNIPTKLVVGFMVMICHGINKKNVKHHQSKQTNPRSSSLRFNATFLSPIVGGHLTLKRVTQASPKKVTSRIARYIYNKINNPSYKFYVRPVLGVPKPGDIPFGMLVYQIHH